MNTLMNIVSRSDNAPPIGTHATELQQALEVVSSSRRRQIIDILHERRSIGMSELVDAVASAEAGPDPVTATERNRVYTALYQTHVPKLAEHGLIDYDPGHQMLDASDKLDVLHAATTAFAAALDDQEFN